MRRASAGKEAGAQMLELMALTWPSTVDWPVWVRILLGQMVKMVGKNSHSYASKMSPPLSMIGYDVPSNQSPWVLAVSPWRSTVEVLLSPSMKKT